MTTSDTPSTLPQSPPSPVLAASSVKPSPTAKLRRKPPSRDQLSADRDMLGQVLTFCTFIGGLSLGSLIETLMNGSAFVAAIQASVGPRFDGLRTPEALTIVLHVLQLMLAGTSISALIGSFFAMLCFINLSRLRNCLAALRTMSVDSDDAAYLIRSAVGKNANIEVFKFYARALAAVAMAGALLAIFTVATIVSQVFAMILGGLTLVLLVLPMLVAANWQRQAVALVPQDWHDAAQEIGE